MSKSPQNTPSFNIEAIQLRLYPFGDYDQIVVFLSRDLGLLRAIAKGARRPKSRIGGSLAPLRCNHVQLYKGKSLYRVGQIQGLYSFSHLQRDYDRLMCGLVAAELISVFSQEEDPQPELYDAMLLTLESLNHSETPRATLLWFLLYFLENQGYAQDWQSCQACEIEFRERDYRFFDLMSGGLRCEDCKSGPQHRYLKELQIEALIHLQQAQQPQSLSLADSLMIQTLALFHQLFENLAEKKLKTFAFLYPDKTELSLLQSR